MALRVPHPWHRAREPSVSGPTQTLRKWSEAICQWVCLCVEEHVLERIVLSQMQDQCASLEPLFDEAELRRR